jgi:aminoacrylate hydrolase
MIQHRIPVGGGWIAAYEDGAGPPLMLLPGLGGRASFWEPIVPALRSQFRVISLDHRGCGASSRCRIQYSVEQMAADTLAVLDALGIPYAHLVGHSTGGAIVQLLGAHHPARCGRLVISSSWAGPDAYVRDSFALRVAVLRGLGVAKYEELVDLMIYPPEWYAKNRAEVAARRRRAEDSVDTEILERRINAVVSYDGRPVVHRISSPSLIIGVRDDAVIPASRSREIHEAIRGSELQILNTGGHAAPRIESRAFLGALARFLGVSSC